MSEPATTSKGLQLPCPKCSEQLATIMLTLCDPDTFHCSECDEDFDRSDIDAFIAKWSRMLAWIDTIPGE